MAEIAFTGRGKLDLRRASTSPEMTTNGMLPKCWVRETDGIYLYKGAMKGLEPYSEFYAAQVAEALGFRHVKYELAKFKGRICSKCRLFTSASWVGLQHLTDSVSRSIGITTGQMKDV